MSKLILITGSAGYIGSNLYNGLKKYGKKVIGIDIINSNTVNKRCDIGNDLEFQNILSETKPSHIIHLAAIKSLKECESKKALSWKVNVSSSNTILQYCYKKDIKVIFISSDIVFDGREGDYKEDDLPNPINWYGTTKLHSELLIKNLTNYAICRTAMVIGNLSPAYKTNLSDEINSAVLNNQTLLPHYVYNRLYNNKRIKLPSDVISSPTHIDLLVYAIIKIIEINLRGTFHIAGSESISRYAFAQKIADYHNFNKKLISEDKLKILKIRPKNVSLNIKKSYSKLGLSENDWNINSIIKRLKWEKIPFINNKKNE